MKSSLKYICLAMFWLGWVFCSLIFAFIQDWYGQEAYIKHCQESWITIPWIVWLILLFPALWKFWDVWMYADKVDKMSAFFDNLIKKKGDKKVS